MDDTETFAEFVEHICRRPRMYVCGGSFYEVCAYIAGYAHASTDCPLSGEGFGAFNAFVCAAFRFPSKYAWPYVIHKCCRDDDEATEQLRVLLIEFVNRTKTESHRDIIEEMLSRRSDREEGEPEKAWRRFYSAVLRGRREDIEPLIQDHPDMHVLSAGACPSDVASLLDGIAESYPVQRIAGSDNEGNATVMTPDFGPVKVKLIRGTWRVDATKIIACWKANRDNAQGEDQADS